MAADNNSVFEDEKELEKYGVWVKTGPEEIDDIDDDTNFDLSDLEDEAIISDEEEEMLGKLENELSQEDISITENNLNLSESMDIKDLDFEDLEEVEIGELLEEDELKDSTLNTVKNEEVFDLDIDFEDDLNFPADNKSELHSAEKATVTEIMSTESNSEIEGFDLNEIEDIDLDADFNIDDMEMLDLDEELPVEIDMDSIQNVELEDDIVDFDVDEILNNPENDLEDLDVDLLLEEDSEELVEFEELHEVDELIELKETDEILEAEEITDLSSVDELEEIQDIVLPINDSSEITVDFDETERIIEDLTDLDDLEEIDFEESEATEVAANINQKETGDLASEILLKIEKELLSIKSELHDVKKELSTLRPGNQNKISDTKEDSESIDPGFFEEDEDETIALTGDELDNILNTAEIIEETGSESDLPEELVQINELEENSLLIDNKDIITIEEETVIEEPVEIDLDIDSIEEEIIVEEPVEIDLDIDSIEEEIIVEEPVEIDLDIDSIEEETIAEEPVEIDLNIDSIEEETIVEEPIEIDLNIDSIEEETIVEEPVEIDLDILDNLEDIQVEASEPETTSTIDIELPEMQDTEDEIKNISTETNDLADLSPQLKSEIKSVLSYMDQLLESLPEDKIHEFANSEHYEVYRKLFEELGLNEYGSAK